MVKDLNENNDTWLLNFHEVRIEGLAKFICYEVYNGTKSSALKPST